MFSLRFALLCLATCWLFVSSGVPKLSGTCVFWLFLSGLYCFSILVSVKVWTACSDRFAFCSYFHTNTVVKSLCLWGSLQWISLKNRSGWSSCLDKTRSCFYRPTSPSESYAALHCKMRKSSVFLAHLRRAEEVLTFRLEMLKVTESSLEKVRSRIEDCW